MARPKHGERKVTEAEVKRIARQQMDENGTAGISLRGIARELDVTAPAIYNYYRRMDDLITALIVDAFHMLADAVDAAGESEADAAPLKKIELGMLAYRQWALDNPADFQLIFGNPIPGYQAPPEVTVPAARRPFRGLIIQAMAAYRAGDLVIPAEYESIPPMVQAHLDDFLKNMDEMIQPDAEPIPSNLFYMMINFWAYAHGMIMLELFHHTPPVLGDTAAYYRNQVRLTIQGMRPCTAPDCR